MIGPYYMVHIIWKWAGRTSVDRDSDNVSLVFYNLGFIFTICSGMKGSHQFIFTMSKFYV